MPAVGAPATCPACGAQLAPDQRYCLECGERCAPMSSVLSGGPPTHPAATPAGPVPPSASPPGQGAPQRSNWVTVLAGVGVLLLAMGVGVLIGRAGSSKQAAPAAQVITVNSAGGGSSTGAAAATFTGDWPSGTNGYTVQLQTLPVASTQLAAVEAAKTAASAKGAKAVGALKSEEFSSLAGADYVIYSGVYHKKAEAEKALAGVKKSFPAAKVIEVNNGGGSSSGEEGGSSSAKGATGNNPTKPAPPTVLKSLQHSGSGTNYEKKSKELPNVVETG